MKYKSPRNNIDPWNTMTWIQKKKNIAQKKAGKFNNNYNNNVLKYFSREMWSDQLPTQHQHKLVNVFLPICLLFVTRYMLFMFNNLILITFLPLYWNGYCESWDFTGIVTEIMVLYITMCVYLYLGGGVKTIFWGWFQRHDETVCSLFCDSSSSINLVSSDDSPSTYAMQL